MYTYIYYTSISLTPDLVRMISVSYWTGMVRETLLSDVTSSSLSLENIMQGCLQAKQIDTQKLKQKCLKTVSLPLHFKVHNSIFF